MGIRASDYKITATGEPLPTKELDRLRKEAPETQLLMHTMKDEYIMEAFTRPGVIVGSDAPSSSSTPKCRGSRPAWRSETSL